MNNTSVNPVIRRNYIGFIHQTLDYAMIKNAADFYDEFMILLDLALNDLRVSIYCILYLICIEPSRAVSYGK